MSFDDKGMSLDEDVGGRISQFDVTIDRLERIVSDDQFQKEWLVADQVYPGHPKIWTVRIKRLIKAKSFEQAIAEIDAHEFGEDLDEFALVDKAELLYDARAHERADELYAMLLGSFPQRRDLRTNYAKRLLADGYLAKAHQLLEPLRPSLSEGSRGEAMSRRASGLMALLSRLEGRPVGIDEDARLLAMKHAILWFSNRKVSAPPSHGLGRLTLITGSLGPGGAERQLSRLAIELERARRRGETVGGVELTHPVEIVVRSHGPEKQNDFYLNEIQEAGVELSEINLFKPIAARALGITDPELLLLLDFLPPSVNYGVKRLTDHLRRSRTDTASAWQDGACLFAGLAALIAGVPQIQLAIRGLPPSMRRHMFRPEYEILYRAMGLVPGVTFISNNYTAARAYAEWLDLPLDRFRIVYNGVEPMNPAGTSACEQRWADFVAATADVTHTIGGVFRFDTDKQPNLWIRFAHRYLKQHPQARIVLVGGGRLLEGAQQLAEELGISDRILFTDRSTRVGYWMSRMDALVLMSRYEGLPNVLIEAQYMGVRVVTTPAGGAAECLIDGTTGYVLDCCEKPDLDRCVELTYDMAMRAEDRSLFSPGGAARNFLDGNFSVPHMLAQYANCTAQGLHQPEVLKFELGRSRRAA